MSLAAALAQPGDADFEFKLPRLGGGVTPNEKLGQIGFSRLLQTNSSLSLRPTICAAR